MPVAPEDHNLGPLSRDVLWALNEASEPGEGFTWDEAVIVIKEANSTHENRLWTSTDPDRLDADIRDILQGLINRGYLYEVDEELRITERK